MPATDLGGLIIDAVCWSGSKHSNDGDTAVKRVRPIVKFIPQP